MIDDELDEKLSAQVVPVSVIESQERANIDMLVATAKRYPRDLERVQRRMEKMATMDLETAESCTYHLERDGHAIEGPSVRMAEIAVSCYQNIRFGVHVVSNDGKVVIAQGFCHDTENNTFGMWETQRRITDKKGRTYTEDMQITTANAAAAIAFRNAVFKVIPTSLVKAVEVAARKYAVGDLKTLIQRRSRLLRRFAALGVREDRILQFLGYDSIEQITVEDIDRLIGIGTAIKEETTTIEETFGPDVPQKPNLPRKGAKTPLDEPPDDLDLSPPTPPEPPKATEPVKEPPPQPQPPPPAPAQPKVVTPPPAQRTFPQQGAEPMRSLTDQVKERLADEGVSEQEFLTVVEAYAYTRDKQGKLHTIDEIRAGTFTLNDMSDEHLRIANMNWRSISEAIDRMRRGEEP